MGSWATVVAYELKSRNGRDLRCAKRGCGLAVPDRRRRALRPRPPKRWLSSGRSTLVARCAAGDRYCGGASLALRLCETSASLRETRPHSSFSQSRRGHAESQRSCHRPGGNLPSARRPACRHHCERTHPPCSFRDDLRPSPPWYSCSRPPFRWTPSGAGSLPRFRRRHPPRPKLLR